MLLVKWRPEAIVALIEIIDYIEQYNPVAAVSLHQTIVVAAEGLSLMPYGFSTVACLVLGKWLFIQTTWWCYRVTEHVEIVMVLHTRQEYPRDVIGPHHSTSRQ